jgi:DMSO/TMAO reductase YedYZ molybdopterin-dependent catalytic subunit
MQKKWLVVSCIALLVGILATAALAGNPVKLFVNGQKSMIKDENEQEEVVRLVEDFGRKLKSVSLLAPQETVNKSVQENYGDFIAPALLAEWQKDLQKVPGRLLSSPWPERIEILSVNELAESGYLVKGEIIEMTSVEMVNGGAAARRPITLEVEKLKNRWLITAVQMDSYVEAGATVYKNTEYGFSFSLPESWRGYSVIADEWEGFTPGG